LLLVAAALAWREVGSGSLSALWQHLAAAGATPPLQAAAVCLSLAVALRTALLPAHGWLIQVMEAPTPVSALLHAGVVNLGGYVLIRFAPLLGAAPAARWLLAGLGLATAVLAGLVMLTRITVKVRLAWSTVAQMGFMLLECGLGLYTLAALHLVGHSLYKAHAFLSASTVVRETRLRSLRGTVATAPASLLAAPLVALAIVAAVQALVPAAAWPWWWSAVLALAWAPLLWLPAQGARTGWRALVGLGLVAALTALAALAHLVPLGVHDRPDAAAGPFAAIGMAGLYLCLAALQWRPQALATWRRWSYAGFYVDEFYTRLALRLWPTRWAPAPRGKSLPTVPVPSAR
jgi:NAD(P)H-quinone oxidoreductase subunit 5